MNRINIKKNSDDDIQISIKRYWDKTSTSQAIFLAIGIVALIFSIWQMFINERIFIIVFIIIWCVIWIFFLSKIWKVLKWRRFSNEIILLTKDKLTLKEILPFSEKVQSYTISDILITPNDCSISPARSIFELHPGTLNIENKNHYILKSFGKYLEIEESILLIKELQLSNKPGIAQDKFKKEIPNTDYSKSLGKSLNKIRKQTFFISLLPVFILNYFQIGNKHNLENEVYLRLKTNGILTNVNSEFQKHWDTDYFYYYFIAQNGQKIENSGKCGDIDDFNKEYKDLKVIYNPSNPEEYMEYPHFQFYSTNYPVLWLILSTLFYSLVVGTVAAFGYLVFKGHLRTIINQNGQNT